MMLTDKRVLITGGTGSLGRALARRLLSMSHRDTPEQVIVFSRDEAKQEQMRREFADQRLLFCIGDVRDYKSVVAVLRGVNIVIHAAALKQVPSCEYHPQEAVATNIGGAENIVRAIREFNLPVETVVGISTDKACKPVNVMGMTKAIQERVFIQANLDCPQTRFVCVRYGNVLASRGSVIPLFQEQIRAGGPVTLTSPTMTRFLLSMDDAVATVLAALRNAERGEIYVPCVPSAFVLDIANAMIGGRTVAIKFVGIRPGEKLHEILISEEEMPRTVKRDAYYAIRPALPELLCGHEQGVLVKEYSSFDCLLTMNELCELLESNGLLVPMEGVSA